MRLFVKLFMLFSISIILPEAKMIHIKKGWQLLGTSEKIENMRVFREDCVSQVITYRNGKWLKYSAIDDTLSYIDNQEGFWAFGEDNCTIQTTLVTIPKTAVAQTKKVQKTFQPETEITQDVSHINSKTVVFSSDIRLTYEEAKEYCIEHGAYLPTKDELMAHYLYALQNGRIYSSGRHWSSSESKDNSDYAYEVILYFALQTPKNTKLYARCMRNSTD